MKKFILMSLCLLVATGTAMAHWVPEDGHKMHFPQLPDEDGWDVKATFPKVLADDWQCSWTGPVDDIHWWGSWKGGEVGTILTFILSIHANIVDGGEGFSIPGEQLWQREFDPDAVPIDPPTDQGWYDPDEGTFIRPDHKAYFQYNVVDIQDPFRQHKDTIYWLNISAIVVETDKEWGWKSSENHWNDDAVFGHLDPAGMPLGDWRPMYEPPDFTQTLDLAFVITPEPATIALLGLGALALLRRKRGYGA